MHPVNSYLHKDGTSKIRSTCWDGLTVKEQKSLIEFSRKNVSEAEEVDKRHFKSYVRASQARRKNALDAALKRTAKLGAEALEYFAKERWTSVSEMTTGLSGKSEAAKKQALKDQINTRVKGIG